MNDLALTRRWLAARIKLTLRNPRAVTFTFAFPLVLVVLFNALNGDTMVKSARTSRSHSSTRRRSASSASSPRATRR